MENQPFKDTIDKINECQKEVHDAMENTEDVKSGISTPDEERQDPGYVLYQSIMEVTKKVLEDPTIVKIVRDTLHPEAIEQDRQYDIWKNSGPNKGSFRMVDYSEHTKKFAEMMALIVANASYQSVVIYDTALKKELTNQFNNVGTHLNRIKSDVDGIKIALRQKGISPDGHDGEFKRINDSIEQLGAQLQVLQKKTNVIMNQVKINSSFNE